MMEIGRYFGLEVWRILVNFAVWRELEALRDKTLPEVEYTNLSGFDNQWYRDLILKALQEHGKLRRSDFDLLLIPKLPGILTEEQKVNKVENLLRKLRSEGKIRVGEKRYWILSDDSPSE